MNKAELVSAIAERSKDLDKAITKKTVDAVLTLALDEITSALARSEKVTLVGFGTFEARDRKEREGRNPKTGESLTIPATKVLAFSAGKSLKESLKESMAIPV